MGSNFGSGRNRPRLRCDSLARHRTTNCSLGAAASAAYYSRCVYTWMVKCREHISLLVILCIIVYVKNKAHLSLILILARQHLILVTEKRLVNEYFSSSFSSTKLRLDRGSTLAVWEGQRALGIHQKYLNLCSEDEQRSSILPSVKTICTI